MVTVFRQWQEIFLFAETSGIVADPTQPPIQFVQRWPRREADNLLPSSAKVKNEWMHTSTPPRLFTVWAGHVLNKASATIVTGRRIFSTSHLWVCVCVWLCIVYVSFSVWFSVVLMRLRVAAVSRWAVFQTNLPSPSSGRATDEPRRWKQLFFRQSATQPTATRQQHHHLQQHSAFTHMSREGWAATC